LGKIKEKIKNFDAFIKILRIRPLRALSFFYLNLGIDIFSNETKISRE
tara:strand:+ start:480 stop:623 length:144 start_codon:yes stop_codon:yes gene_type:complete